MSILNPVSLAARLTGFKIDIKSETQARESGDFYDYDDEAEETEETVSEELTADDAADEIETEEDAAEEVPVDEESEE